MHNPIISFIGAGHMAGALIGGLIKAAYPSSNIWASCRTQTRLQELVEQYGIQTSQDNIECAAVADIVVLAVKPQVMEGILVQLQPTIHQRNPLVISVAAGVSERHLRTLLGGQTAIIRTMPNTPALVGHGATVLYANSLVSEQQKQQAEQLFSAVGSTLWLDDERYMNSVTAMSGSGPAYFFLLLEALEEAAIKLGLPEGIVHDLVMQTALGSIYMAAESKEPPALLRKQVASPGGGTERALQVLESGHFKDLIFAALQAAKERYDSFSS